MYINIRCILTKTTMFIYITNLLRRWYYFSFYKQNELAYVEWYITYGRMGKGWAEGGYELLMSLS